MLITRRDIVSKQFTSTGDGYASDEVDAYLDDIADDIDLRDDALTAEKRRVGALIAELRRMETEIEDLKVRAGVMADAEAEAKELLEQARLQAKRLMLMARDEAKNVVEEAVEQGRLIVRKAGERANMPSLLKDRIQGAAFEAPAKVSAAAVEEPDAAPDAAPDTAPDSDVVYPQTDWLKDPESRYDA